MKNLPLLSVIISFLLIINNVVAQPDIPRVPKQIKFGDITLQLNDAVIAEIQGDVHALRSSDRFFQIKLDRVNLYFPIIERIFREEGVPEDFKYLAIQESGLISDAVSSSNAVGYWQFKDFTAREVGMRVDHQVDERKNIVSSTYGAAKYLKRNNFQMDNWIYAMSAYQAGMGGARKYNNEKYYGAKKMPITKETHWYIKKFIAHKVAFENEIGGTHSEGIKLLEYTKGAGKDLEKIAGEFKVEEDLLKHYNKWLAKGKVPDDKIYTVIIPVQGKFNEKLLADKPEKSVEQDKKIETPENRYPSSITTPRFGNPSTVSLTLNGLSAVVAGDLDQFAGMAADAALPLDRFLKYNDLSSSSQVKKGQVYYLQGKRNKSEIGYHVAQTNESLWDVSQRYGIRLNALLKKNRMDEPSELKPGRVLWMGKKRPQNTKVEYHEYNPVTPAVIVSNTVRMDKPIERFSQPVTMAKKDTAVAEPQSPPVDEPELMETETKEPVVEIPVAKEIPLVIKTEPEKVKPPEPVNSDSRATNKKIIQHAVSSGETLWGISRKYGVTIDEILEWNNMTKYDPLSIGKILQIGGVAAESDSKIPTNNKRKIGEYEVKSGDTFYRIAQEHSMEVSELMELNNRADNKLSVGEKIKVYK